jgi:D-alanyl-D-alanine carboxypeptidase (penicillin-binding protein 5/6)
MNIFKLVSIFLLPLLAFAAQAKTPIPSTPTFKSSGHILMDYNTGYVISEDNPDTPLEPASLTKIMTAFVAFRELHQGNMQLDEETTVSEKAWRTGGSKMFIEVGKQVKIQDLLYGLIIQSGNDAAVALAEHIAGSEEAFAEMMNIQARSLGMKNTHFVNATGWPADGHTTTARDLAILTQAMIRQFPEHYAWHAIKKFSFNNIEQYNRNKLLWRDQSVDGVKTGHTEAAGYCLVASAQRDDMRLISVVLGTPSEEARATASSKLLNYGFRFYETRTLYASGKPLTDARVWKSDKGKLKLGLKNDLVMTIPRGDYKLLKAELEVNNQIIAPVQNGQAMGKLIIKLGDKVLNTRPLVALEHVPEGGWMTRAVDSMRLMLE